MSFSNEQSKELVINHGFPLVFTDNFQFKLFIRQFSSKFLGK